MDDESVRAELRDKGPARLADFFAAHRERLRRLIVWRMDPRLKNRLDASDVLQEVYLDAQRRLDEFLTRTDMPLALWLRLLTGRRLVELHRQHVGAAMRSADQEVPLDGWAWASAPSLATQLVGHLTSPSQAASRAETAARLTEALESMDPIDREILVLRHFDELSNNEVAALLGLQKAAASNRYVRALRRLREILAGTEGLGGSLA